MEYCDGRKKVEGKWVLGKEERHAIPRRFWDKNGELYPSNEWHDAFYGPHEDHRRTGRDDGCCGK